MRACWCGNAEFLPFNAEYGKCIVCGTLVSQQSLTDEQLVVADDETDFYGKRYWLGHQAEDLGFPDIYARARNDLTERNLHWLRTLLKYSPPPARTLELGCGHGSFVGLLAQAGYDASGTEMSAWVVEFGKKTFGVPIALGPIEDQAIAEGSLDVIVSFDVLEHLSDPLATMDRCLQLLKRDGVLLIQTPRFREAMTYAQLVEDDDPFLVMLQPDEHLYLFTEQSAIRLFSRLGVEHVAFEPAIFAEYDMFFAVGRTAPRLFSCEEWEASLSATPGGRIAQALLDQQARELSLADDLRIAEVDRKVRGESVTSLTAMLAEAEADRAARGAQVTSLSSMVEEAEHDRTARGEQVAVLEKLLEESERDRGSRGVQVGVLQGLLDEAERDRVARGEQVVELTRLLAVAEGDRLSRSQQIDALAALLEESERDREARGAHIATLTRLVEEAQAVPLDVDALMRYAETADADRIARGKQVETLTALLNEAEADRAARGEQIVTLTAMLNEVEIDRTNRGTQIETLTKMVRQAAADRTARERSLVAWRQRVEEALQSIPVKGDRQRERWTEIRSLLDEIGSEHA